MKDFDGSLIYYVELTDDYYKMANNVRSGLFLDDINKIQGMMGDLYLQMSSNCLFAIPSSSVIGYIIYISSSFISEFSI